MSRIGLIVVLLLAGAVRAAGGDDPTTAEGWLKRGSEQYAKRQFADAVTSLTKCLELAPDNADALDLRGSAQFMTGKFGASVADFDRHIKLRPEAANGHWRRGISLYYAGKYDDGRKQFEGYEKVDTNDVENAVWHFLCAAKKDGEAKARAGMLAIGKDRRVPMMEVYDLFRGKLKPADVLAAANEGKLSDAQRKPRLFYAHLYLGLYYDVKGETKQAKDHLALAAEKYRIDHYMGDVARVHAELLAKAK
jgi:lipoprotein NlpI